MSKSLLLIGSISLISLGLTLPAMGTTRVPSATYEIHPGVLLDESPYISGFECLIHGENIARRPACDYYKAVVSGPQTSGKIPKEVCFKELTPVSTPREYKAEKSYRFIIETKRSKHDGFDGITLARILSNDPYPYPNVLNPSKWYETTTIALYDCNEPYDGKSYN